MPNSRSTAPQNHLIERLSRRDRARFLAGCETVQLVPGSILCEPGEVTHHVYFPVDGFVSLITQRAGSPGLEVGMIGREGMLGAQLFLGVAQAPLHAVVQGTGASWRMGAAAFRSELARSDALRRGMGLYVHVLMQQLAGSAGCLRYHQIGPRLARWLLMSRDRAHSNSFHITHEFLAYMLGVRRVGITAAAGELRRAGLIEYRRGEVSVLDGKRLEAAACGCYAADRRAYAALLA